jgi:CRISPR-associated protein Cas2
MVLMLVENATKSLRGELSRFLLEPKAGVFVGKVSALVRDKLWEYCIDRKSPPCVIQIWSDSNEQGFSIRSYGDRTRDIRNCEGLWLVAIPDDSHAEKVRRIIEQAGLKDET